MVLPNPDLERAQTAILATIREASAPYRPTELYDVLRDQGIRDELMRVALWLLIGRDEIRLTPDRLLARPSTNGVEAGGGETGVG